MQLQLKVSPAMQHSFEKNRIADEQIRADLNEPVRKPIKPAALINSSVQRKSQQVTTNPTHGERTALAGQQVSSLLLSGRVRGENRARMHTYINLLMYEHTQL